MTAKKPSPDPVRAALRSVPLFARAEGGLFDRVVEKTRIADVAQGEHILREREKSEHLYVLLEGTAGVFYSSGSGENVLVKIFGAPSVFGEMELLAGLPRMEYVEAFEPAKVAIVDGDAVLALWRVEPAASYAMLTDLARRLCVAAYHERALAFHDVEARVADVLLSFMDAYARTLPDGRVMIKYALSYALLARCLGVTSRSIDRTFRDWTEQGLVDRQKGFLVFSSREALVERAGEDRLALFTRVT